MVFPVLIPTLTATPMTVFNARALASLVSVAGTALNKRLTVILNAIVRVLEGPEGEDEELKSAADEALRALLSSINDSEGLNTLMMILLGWCVGSMYRPSQMLILRLQGQTRICRASYQRLQYLHCVLRSHRTRYFAVPHRLD